VEIPVHARNNSRVSCYNPPEFFFKNLRAMARVSCYKTTCLLLRFHVYRATRIMLSTLVFSRLGLPPVVTCIDPCRNAPVVGEMILWKNGGSATTTMRAALRGTQNCGIQIRSPPVALQLSTEQA
jgi:hypothetical protein